MNIIAAAARFAGLSCALWSASAIARGGDHVTLGVGVAHVPTYQGADDYRTLPVPVIDLVSGPLYANLRDGVGIHVIRNETFTIGGGVGVMPGYRRRDVPAGVDKLPFGAGARLFANVNAGGVIATIGGIQGFAGGSKGFIADASLSYPIIMTPHIQLIPSVGASWADRKHNDRYFGIDAGEAAASGLRRFRAGGGVKDASALLTVNYRMTDRINLTASGGVTTLLGEVKDSPLVVRRTRPTGFLALSYRLGS